MRRRDLLAGLSLAPLTVPAVAQCVVPTFPRINLPGRCEADGGPPPSLDLSFMTPGTLDPRITFTRASVGTYFDSAGVMQTAAVNAPRWDYDPSTHELRGLLIEETRTNLVLQSASLAVAPWTPAGVVVAAPTVTADQVVAPDGTTTAARIVYPQVIGAGAVSYVRQPITMSAVVYTYSMWLRGAVGGEQVYLLCADAVPTYHRTLVTLTTSWQRFTMTTGTLTAASWNFGVGTDLRDGTQTTKPAQTIYAWGAQLEAGPTPTSYIATTSAAVTRAVDICNITPLGSWFNASAGTLLMDFDASRPGSTIGGFSSGAFANTLYYTLSSNQLVANIAGAGTTIAQSGVTPGVPAKVAASYSAGRLAVSVNGQAPAINATLPAGPYPWTGNLSVGAQPWSLASTNICGHARRWAYWSSALSNAEMQAISIS